MALFENNRIPDWRQPAAPPRPDGTGLEPERAIELATDKLGELKRRIHDRIIEDVDSAKLRQFDPQRLRLSVERTIEQLLLAENNPQAQALRPQLIAEIADDVLGLGPLEPLLHDDAVSEIMVNAADEIFVEKHGVLSLSGRRFRDDEHIMLVIERVLAPLGRRLDETSPIVDARLPQGFRMNAIVPPLALRGPTITIRKFFNERLDLDELIRLGSVSPQAATLLCACVEARLNIIISGGTGTGKTTFLNALSASIPETERIVTIEDPAELRLKQRHVVTLETRPANIDGKNRVTQRDLVVNALRMRPDRIIVGEVRAGEAFDMLQAMNTGHEGSISTVHANSPRDALSRIENMVMMAGFELPVRVIREQMAAGIDLVIHLSRRRDGARRVAAITEVVGMEGQVITTQDLFEGNLRTQPGAGREPAMRPTGIRPGFLDRFEEMGIRLPDGLFDTRGYEVAWSR